MKPLLLRADATRTIGTGHAMRCLALAHAWQDAGGEAVLAMTEPSPVTARVLGDGVRVRPVHHEPGSPADAAATAAAARGLAAEWIVMDGYHFGVAYQRALKDAGLRVLCVDDYGHAGRYCADLVLNQNVSADASLYADRAPATELLLGTRYAVLRREFLARRNWRRPVAPLARRVLVTLGGSDPENATLTAVAALGESVVAPLEARIVVGPANPHIETIRREAGGRGFEVVSDAVDMPGCIAWADVAIAAGGTTSWELAFLGLPSLVIILAENQRAIAERLDEAGVAVNLGDAAKLTPRDVASALSALSADPSRRQRMAERGRALVDGDGVARVLMRLTGEAFRLRRATEADARALWHWTNEPSTRANSFSAAFIPWDDHVAWLGRKLADATCALFIAVDRDDEPFAQVCFDVDGREATISVSVAPGSRGHGLGSAVIRRAAEAVARTRGIELVRAFVKPGNEASVRAFGRAGFRAAAPVTVGEQPALQFTYAAEGRA